jgi:hypothetical protein
LTPRIARSAAPPGLRRCRCGRRRPAAAGLRPFRPVIWSGGGSPASRHPGVRSPPRPAILTRWPAPAAGQRDRRCRRTGDAARLPGSSRAPRAGHKPAVGSSAHPRVREAGQVSPGRAGPQVSGQRKAASPRCADPAAGGRPTWPGWQQGEDDDAVPLPPAAGPSAVRWAWLASGWTVSTSPSAGTLAAKP